MKIRTLMGATLVLAGLVLPATAAVENVATRGTAASNRPLWTPGNWNVSNLNDGDLLNHIHLDTVPDTGAAYTLDLGASYPIKELKIYPRKDLCCAERLRNIRVSIHTNSGGQLGGEVWGANLFTADGENAGNGPGRVVSLPVETGIQGQWVRINALSQPVGDYALQMSEIEVYAEVLESDVNRARDGFASSTRQLFNGNKPSKLNNGDHRNAIFGEQGPLFEFSHKINLGASIALNRIVIWTQQDASVPQRLSNYQVSIHKDNKGQLGDQVWSVDLHTDGSSPGAEVGFKDVLTAALNASGTFKGQWIKITSLDYPIHDYAMPISEVEAFGAVESDGSLLIIEEPTDVYLGVGQTTALSVKVSVVGSTTPPIFQWKKNGADIDGATNSTYTTEPSRLATGYVRYRCVVSHATLPELSSHEVTVRINLALGSRVFNNQPLWAPGGWKASLIVDGDNKSFIHGDAALHPGFAYEIDLGASVQLSEMYIWPRQDACCPDHLANFRVSIHKDNNGQIGESVWKADLYTDGTNPGGLGRVFRVQGWRDNLATFEGQWIRITALDVPVKDFSLQIAEVEVSGNYSLGVPDLQLTRPPSNYGTVPGRTARFTVGVKVINGDPAKVAYQWKRDGVNIPGATTNVYVTPPLLSDDTNAVFRCTMKYTGVPELQTDPVKVFFDYNYAKHQPTFNNQPLWSAGGWNISMLVDDILDDTFHGDVGLSPGFKYEVYLGGEVEVDHIAVWPRQDGTVPERLSNIRVQLLTDSAGQPGVERWHADLFTDGSNPGSTKGTVVTLNSGDGTGSFLGSWVRITALDNPVKDFSLQMTELQVFGKLSKENPPTVARKISIIWDGEEVKISFEGGTLQEADTLGGGFTPSTGAVDGVKKVSAAGGKKFYRVKR
ncbi:MAG: discoidin domain-containing protein [Pedosphaera sp.]|nr:discoidin domain-containing protein [Pedosphaera sp.]